VRTMLLSGDARAATETIAAAIGADEWTAEANPSRRLRLSAIFSRREPWLP
jgi:cation transport ATPase